MRIAVPLLLVFMLGALSFTSEPAGPQTSPAPSLVGTYWLVSRQMPDGTMLRVRCVRSGI